MASSSSEVALSAPRAPSARSSSTGGVDPVLRNTLRYTISAREYALLHRHVLSRSRVLRRKTPGPTTMDKTLSSGRRSGGGYGGGGDYNERAVRHALRVFSASWLGMKGWEAVARRIGSGEWRGGKSKKQAYHKSPALQLSLSLSTILLLYRFLFRFLSRLRAQLLDAQVEPFRRRNPRTASVLTSPYAPAVGASLAGLALGIYPSQQLRVSISIYLLFRALEFAWNMCEKEGLVWGFDKDKKRQRPWWFGSWLLQPFSFGQLLHACFFDGDCFPESYGNFIFNKTTVYLHERPKDWPGHMPWPKASQIVDSFAEMARLNWPAYISPTLFPQKEALPASLQAVAPLTARAHPLLSSLSCATLHPSDRSCLRTYVTFWLNSFPPLARFFVVACSALTVVSRFDKLHDRPVATVQQVLARALRLSTFVTGAISSSWASICLFQAYLPRHVLATQRFFFGGFLAGLWAWVERQHGRGIFLYSACASVDSLWKVGVKRRWWRAVGGGDVWVFGGTDADERRIRARRAGDARELMAQGGQLGARRGLAGLGGRVGRGGGGGSAQRSL